MSNTYNKYLSLKDKNLLKQLFKMVLLVFLSQISLVRINLLFTNEVKYRHYVVVRKYDKKVIRDCIHPNKYFSNNATK